MVPTYATDAHAEHVTRPKARSSAPRNSCQSTDRSSTAEVHFHRLPFYGPVMSLFASRNFKPWIPNWILLDSWIQCIGFHGLQRISMGIFMNFSDHWWPLYELHSANFGTLFCWIWKLVNITSCSLAQHIQIHTVVHCGNMEHGDGEGVIFALYSLYSYMSYLRQFILKSVQR